MFAGLKLAEDMLLNGAACRNLSAYVCVCFCAVKQKSSTRYENCSSPRKNVH
jgi:hypothetical protein